MRAERAVRSAMAEFSLFQASQAVHSSVEQRDLVGPAGPRGGGTRRGEPPVALQWVESDRGQAAVLCQRSRLSLVRQGRRHARPLGYLRQPGGRGGSPVRADGVALGAEAAAARSGGRGVQVMAGS